MSNIKVFSLMEIIGWKQFNIFMILYCIHLITGL